ncbi:MAG: shikimate dehydrogenase [Vicinamibacterales bacterium]
MSAPTTAELRRRRDAAEGADLVELRLDSVSDADVAAALAGRRCPVIVTCRPTWEGGAFAGSEEERLGLLEQALQLGAEYVDVEWKAAFAGLVASAPDRIVLSSHDFSGVPHDLAERARHMAGIRPGVVKLAVKADRLSDSLRLMELRPLFGGRQRSVLIAMGDAGVATRVLAGRFGSAWSYAGAARGIGQIDAALLVSQFRYRSLTPATEVYGVVGRPVAHSMSPAMHNAAFAATGIDAVYLPLAAADVDDFLSFARGIGLQGASVTIPYKTDLLGHVQLVDEVTRRTGALNTLKRDGETWAGRNTDLEGFLQPLRDRQVPLTGRRVSILGAGGSARSVALALASHGAAITVHARDAEKAARVASIVNGAVGPMPPLAGSWDVLVNCTPIGMHPRVADTPVPASALAGSVVYDLVYNPQETRLLRDATTAGCETIGGLDMLVAQAEAQFEWWTGRRPPSGVMRAAASARLSEFKVNDDHVV